MHGLKYPSLPIIALRLRLLAIRHKAKLHLADLSEICLRHATFRQIRHVYDKSDMSRTNLRQIRS